MVRAVRLCALRRRAGADLGHARSPGAGAVAARRREQKAWFCGPPSQVIDGIRSIEAKYPGLEDFMIHWAEGLPPAEFKEQLRWFAEEVMPAFNCA